MKKIISAALLTAGLLTCSNCFAALEYNYDRVTKVFTVKSEDIIPLENGANELKIAFVKEYVLTPGKYGLLPKGVEPTLRLNLSVEGSKDYRFADNANYWQEHNYTYKEMIAKHAYDLEKLDLEKAKQDLRAEQNENTKPTLEQKAIWQERREALSRKDQELFERAKLVVKDPKKLGRNPSTLIYLKVENKLTGERKASTEFEFGAGNDEMPDILVEKEIKDQAAQRAKMVEQVKATREAFLKAQKEQAKAMSGLHYTSLATTALSKGNNFWKKVVHSEAHAIPMFLEVKFWNGGANERRWLQTDKLKELKELLEYDLYKDTANLEFINSK